MTEQERVMELMAEALEKSLGWMDMKERAFPRKLCNKALTEYRKMKGE